MKRMQQHQGASLHATCTVLVRSLRAAVCECARLCLAFRHASPIVYLRFLPTCPPSIAFVAVVNSSLAQGHNGIAFAISVTWFPISPVSWCVRVFPHVNTYLSFHYTAMIAYFSLLRFSDLLRQVARLSAVVKLPEFVKIKCNMPARWHNWMRCAVADFGWLFEQEWLFWTISPMAVSILWF